MNGTAIVTGGSRGLGRGVAEALAHEKMRVIILARDAAKTNAAAKEIGAEAVSGDAADEALAEKLLKDAPNVVVLCAGASPPLGALQEQTWETFSHNWNVDTKATFVWARQVLRLSVKTHLVVISSGAALRGSPASGGYASAKRAQWFIAEYARAEAERMGLALKIHCLFPTLNPSTELGRAGIAAYADRAGIAPEEFAKRLNPPLTPAILGKAIVDLCSDPSRFPGLAYNVSGQGLSPVS